MVEDTLPQVRGAYGMEPMFSLRDRKLQLVRNDEQAGAFPRYRRRLDARL